MPGSTFSVLDVLDLAPIERTVFLTLARQGPLAFEPLVTATALPIAETRSALDALIARGRARQLPDETYDVVMGKTKPSLSSPAS